MSFYELINKRESCRSYDPDREVEEEKLLRILEATRLAPSACNGQPYRITVARGDMAKAVERACGGMGMNRFATEAPIAIVISEAEYVKSAAIGAKIKHNDYRSIDIGIAVAYLTAAATEEGLSSCILGWLDDAKIRGICSLNAPVRLVVTLGYPKEELPPRAKKRKSIAELCGK